jgi:hypothetical protein
VTINRILLVILIFQALLACAPATLSATENQEKPANILKLKQLYNYSVNDSVDVYFLPTKYEHDSPIILLAETTKAHIVDVKTAKPIATQSAPMTGFATAQLFDNGRGVLLATNEYLQIWRWEDNQLGKKLQGKGYSHLSGISQDGTIAYFEGALWNVNKGAQLLQLEEDPAPNSYDFTADTHYFVSGGHETGAIVVDIPKRKTINQIDLAGISQVRFSANNQLYASYGAELSMDLGGYYPHSIGLFELDMPTPSANFASPNQITCWALLGNNNVIVALARKEIRLLNEQLEVTKHWQLTQSVFACASGKNKTVYIGSKQGTLSSVDMQTGELTELEKFDSPIEKIKTSPDGNYIAIVTRPPGASNVIVYSVLP